MVCWKFPWKFPWKFSGMVVSRCVVPRCVVSRRMVRRSVSRDLSRIHDVSWIHFRHTVETSYSERQKTNVISPICAICLWISPATTYVLDTTTLCIRSVFLQKDTSKNDVILLFTPTSDDDSDIPERVALFAVVPWVYTAFDTPTSDDDSDSDSDIPERVALFAVLPWVYTAFDTNY
jgi:hypothetical protein